MARMEIYVNDKDKVYFNDLPDEERIRIRKVLKEAFLLEIPKSSNDEKEEIYKNGTPNQLLEEFDKQLS